MVGVTTVMARALMARVRGALAEMVGSKAMPL